MLKEEAKRKKLESQILATIGYGNFFILDSYQAFLTLINERPQSYCEYTPDNVPVNMFYDLDACECPGGKLSDSDKEIIVNAFNNPVSIAEEIILKTRVFFESFEFTCNFMVLSAHGWSAEKKVNKMSYHIIVKLLGKDNRNILVKDMEVAKEIAKNLFPELIRIGIVDEKVYKGERVFRTIGSSKPGENRPLVKCTTLSSPDTTDLDSFVCYGLSPETTILNLCDVRLNSSKTKKQKVVHSPSPSFSVIPHCSSSEVQSLLDNLDSKYFTETKYWLQTCHILVSIETSLNVWLNFSSKWENYNEKEATSTFLSIKKKHETCNIGHTIDDLRKLQTRSTMDVIANGGQEFISLSNDSFMDKIKIFDYDESNNSYQSCVGDDTRDFFFRHITCINPATSHNALHFARNNEFGMECKSCGSTHGPFNIPAKYTKLTVIFNQINITNNYNNGIESEFSCNVNIDPEIFKDPLVTGLINQILDGHKGILISEFLHRLEKNFVYSRQEWYFFNGSIWELDGEAHYLKKCIIRFNSNFQRIKAFYKKLPLTETSNAIIKNVHSLITKMLKISFVKEIVEGAKLYYKNDNFVTLLNSKKHLLPFTNGVYDLLQNKFRPAKKDDYIFLTTGYDYDPNVQNVEVSTFLEQVLPDQDIRKYVLKRFADCLNGDLPNTLFLIFIGVGSNGKSQLINLMYYAMGEFGSKIDSTLFTRKRSDANSATPAVIKMKNKRMIYLSEPEANEGLHMSLIKELTGDESNITARQLHKELVDFQMEGKFFLASNELPEVNGADEANWRRIKVVDFPSKFVDHPKANQFKKDGSLPSRLKADVTLRQTFMNTLIDHYYQPEQETEPVGVSRRTNEYRAENNEVEQWVKENIEFKSDEILELTDLNLRRFGPDFTNRQAKGRFRKEVEKVLQKLGTDVPDFNHLMTETGGSKKFKGIKLI